MQTFTRLGEPASVTRPNGVAFRFQYDEHRAPKAVLDEAGGGQTSSYDATRRLTNLSLRDGGAVGFSGFDARGRPQSISLPGGAVSASYNLLGQMTDRTVSFGGESRSESFQYDALGRVTSATYPGGAASFDYDLAGPLVRAEYTGPVGTLVVGYVRDDTARRIAIQYPSGVEVAEPRDGQGRTASIVPSSGPPVATGIAYKGADLPETMSLGAGTVRLEATYDGRRRVTGRRWVRVADDRPIVDLRYVWDAGDLLVARQQAHRGGWTDLFDYDGGRRLRRADHGARPTISEAVPRSVEGFAVPAGVTAGLAPGLYARVVGYDGGGLDLLDSIELIDPGDVEPPPFASRHLAHDPFLHASAIEFAQLGQTFDRGAPDGLGSAARALLFTRPEGAASPTPVAADLRHDGLGQLVGVSRADGVEITYGYGHGGLMERRTVACNGAADCEDRDTAFVYDNGKLLEERDAVGGALLARYYYGLQTDHPWAADLPGPSGDLERFLYAWDEDGSTIGLIDAAGRLVERVHYDAWGQPEIASGDEARPRIASIRSEGGDLLVEFSERVLPAISPTALDAGLADGFEGFDQAIQLTQLGGGPVGESLQLDESAGAAFGTVVRIALPSTAAGTLDLETGDGLFDEAGNPVLPEQVQIFFASGVDATLYTGATAGSTAPTRLARSAFGSPFLFHGQWFDYDTGLVYLRARFYDPSTGVFLVRDPEGYEDSTNLYAGMANNPVSYRDPSGRAIESIVQVVANGRRVVRLTEGAGSTAQAARLAERAASGSRVAAAADAAQDAGRTSRALVQRAADETTTLSAVGRSNVASEAATTVKLYDNELTRTARRIPSLFRRANGKVVRREGRTFRPGERAMTHAEGVAAAGAVLRLIRDDLVQLTEGIQRIRRYIRAGSKADRIRVFRELRAIEKQLQLRLVTNGRLAKEAPDLHRAGGFYPGKRKNLARVSQAGLDPELFVDITLARKMLDFSDAARADRAAVRFFEEVSHDLAARELMRSMRKRDIPIVKLPFAGGGGTYLTHFIDQFARERFQRIFKVNVSP